MPSDDRYPDRRAFLRGTAAAVAAESVVRMATAGGADLLGFDETAGRRRTRAGRRGVPLLVSSRSAPESAFLPAGLDHEILNS
jgi:hypothetical protein